MKRLFSLSALTILGCAEGQPGRTPHPALSQAEAGPAVPSPATGGVDATPGELPATPESPQTPDAPVGEVPAAAPRVDSCELTVNDEAPGARAFYGPAAIRWSADQSVVAVGGQAGELLLDADRGQLLGELSQVPGGSLVGHEVFGWDGGWLPHTLRYADFDAALGVVEVGDGLSSLVLVDLDEGPTTVGEIPWPDDGDPNTWNSLHAVATWDSPKGTRLVLTACDGSDTTGRLSVWSIDASPEKELEVALPGTCSWQTWPGRPLLTVAGHNAVLSQGSGLLLDVDLRNGDLHTAPLPEAEQVLALTSHGPTGRVALTTTAGRLELRQLDNLAVLSVVETVGTVVANPFTYATSVESPLAFSPDGTQLAHLSDGFVADTGTEGTAGHGKVLIRDVSTLAVVRELEVPEAPVEAWNTHGQSAPTGLSFRPDGGALLAALDTGTRVWRCAQAEAPPPEPLDVDVTWPDAIQAAEDQYGVLEVHVAAGGESGRLVKTLWWDGEQPSPAGSALAESVRIPVYHSAGAHTVRFRLTVSDGTRHAEEVRELAFVAP